ncbi:HlyD family efflux transporter periplasmic adaptor subunit [Yangia mangrovi]|uniref:HlyD family efflux transporter periplasmic adaptor subunit n=1 Tax=Alloyangia mangrovi TaxID=1779329 RepID=A0A2A3JUS8_9RHOB|nr:HlyD family efflux transporter periplasmic adaptor subunit [Alloyangia mangrovi]MCT4370379.1 HlyD family efflux transporter periplasmic adaptor subunit [Alloyangia mangrovi]
MKYTRLIIGITAILVTLWVIIGEQMTAASANAVVNAPVVTLRSPIAGDLELQSHALGARLSQNELLAAVTNTRVDTVRLADLQLELDRLDAGTNRMQAQIAALSRDRDALAQRTEVFTKARLAELEAKLTEAQVRQQLLQAGDAGAGATALADAVTAEESRRPGAPTTSALALSHARERVQTLLAARDALREGVFLGDGYNDAPFSEQRRIQLDAQIAELGLTRTEVGLQRAALERRIARARQTQGMEARSELRAPGANMLYWETLQADAVTVQRGDPILRVVDCGQSIITLSVTERVFNTLRVGQDASFRFSGQSKLYPATVGRLAGSGARTVYQNLAIAPSEKHLERYDVSLLVPELNTDTELGCAIGRTGRAFFDGRPLDLFRGWFG